MALKHTTAALISIGVFICVIFVVSTIHNYDNLLASFQDSRQGIIQQVQNNNFHLQIPDWWKQEIEEMKKEFIQENKDKQQNETTIIGKSPMTRQELGRHGWSVLHMTAATYPLKADKDFVLQTNIFLNYFGYFYPCKECGEHFLARIKKQPFTGEGRKDFVQYLCRIHNDVNIDLNKKVVDCENEVFEIWGGSCGCTDEKKTC